MAQDVRPGQIGPKSSRIPWDYSWLTPASLPYFLSDYLDRAWANKFPDCHLWDWAPKEEGQSPGISWVIHRRVPGKANVTLYKPEWRMTIARPESGDVIEVWTQYNTVTYEFRFFSLDSIELHQMVEEFEDFIQNIQPELKKRFVEDFWFEEELRAGRTSETTKSEEIKERVLRYTAHLFKRFHLVYGQLGTVDVKVHFEKQNSLGQRVEDKAVFRSIEAEHDFVEIPSEQVHLIRVSDLPFDELQSLLLTAQASGGWEAVEQVTSDHIYLPGKDFLLGRLTDDKTGESHVGILWLPNKEGILKAPPAGQAYYLTYFEPTLIAEKKLLE